MFGIAVVPSVLLALGMAISPESPRWLFQVFLQFCTIFGLGRFKFMTVKLQILIRKPSICIQEVSSKKMLKKYIYFSIFEVFRLQS